MCTNATFTEKHEEQEPHAELCLVCQLLHETIDKKTPMIPTKENRPHLSETT